MNKENIRKAIDVMGRVMKRGDNFNISSFQYNEMDNGTIVRISEESLHECGSSACFSGWLAVSPEWREFGGEPYHRTGAAVIYLKEEGRHLEPDESLAKFFEIDAEIARKIIYPSRYDDFNIYHKVRSKITAGDVIDVLYELMEKGTL